MLNIIKFDFEKIQSDEKVTMEGEELLGYITISLLGSLKINKLPVLNSHYSEFRPKIGVTEFKTCTDTKFPIVEFLEPKIIEAAIGFIDEAYNDPDLQSVTLRFI